MIHSSAVPKFVITGGVYTCPLNTSLLWPQNIVFASYLKRGEVYAEKVRNITRHRTYKMRGSKSFSYQY